MKEPIKGIALILFGILLCFAEEGLNSNVFAYTSDIPFSLFGTIVGFVGVIYSFRNKEKKQDKSMLDEQE